MSPGHRLHGLPHDRGGLRHQLRRRRRRVRHQAQPRRLGPRLLHLPGRVLLRQRHRDRGRLGGGRLRHRDHRLHGLPHHRGGLRHQLQRRFDAFVTKLNPAGSGLAYSTYLGGSSFDVGHRDRGRLGGGRPRHRGSPAPRTSRPPRGPSTRASTATIRRVRHQAQPRRLGPFLLHLPGRVRIRRRRRGRGRLGRGRLRHRDHHLHGLPHHLGGLRHERQRRRRDAFVTKLALGPGFSAAVDLDPEAACCPQVASDAGGDAVAVWTHSDQSGTEARVRSISAAGALGPVKRLSGANPGPRGFPPRRSRATPTVTRSRSSPAGVRGSGAPRRGRSPRAASSGRRSRSPRRAGTPSTPRSPATPRATRSRSGSASTGRTGGCRRERSRAAAPSGRSSTSRPPGRTRLARRSRATPTAIRSRSGSASTGPTGKSRRE